MSLVTFECDDCTRIYVSYQHEGCPWCALVKSTELLREAVKWAYKPSCTFIEEDHQAMHTWAKRANEVIGE